MPTSPNYGFPYPSVSDAPDGPTQIGALANAVDAALATQINNLNTLITTLSNPPRAQLRQIVLQTIPTSTWTSLTFTAEDYDSHNGHDNLANQSRYVAQISGTYEVGGGVWWAANATGVRLSRWAKNGSLLVGSGVEYTPVTGGQTGYACKPFGVSLNAGEFVELQVWHNRGSNLDTYVGSGGDESQSSMTVTLIRNNNF